MAYVPLLAPELRLDLHALESTLDKADPALDNLFAYPAQSNYSGVKHPLSLINTAQAKGWDVLLDAAAFAPTNRLDLGRWQPEFVALSFYKIFGYPTGLGALLVRRNALSKLQRPWFAGGTIRIASVKAMGHFFADGEAAFEDGTVNYLGIPAIKIGLQHIERIGIETISKRVQVLTGWLLDQIKALKHGNGQRMALIQGPVTTEERGGTITISLFDRDAQPISGQIVERLAGDANISLRTGCFCNPGAGETTFGLSDELMRHYFSMGEGLLFPELVQVIDEETGIDISAVRISLGIVSNFADVYRLMTFLDSFRDVTVARFADVQLACEMPATL